MDIENNGKEDFLKTGQCIGRNGTDLVKKKLRLILFHFY